jgi:hypothetical protein
VLIVIAIIAMVSGGVAFAAFGAKVEADKKHAKTSARTIFHVVEAWHGMNGSSECPSLDQLLEANLISEASSVEDPWGLRYSIVCTDAKVKVVSSGPDHEPDTEDDIHVP